MSGWREAATDDYAEPLRSRSLSGECDPPDELVCDDFEKPTVIRRDDPWPIAISDGLGMPCSDCGQEPRFDYRVTDEFWRQHVPEKPARLSVVCLPCLNRRCDGDGLAAALTFVQWTGTGHTVELLPARRFEYGDQ